jgi:hypothetical protein
MIYSSDAIVSAAQTIAAMPLNPAWRPKPGQPGDHAV